MKNRLATKAYITILSICLIVALFNFFVNPYNAYLITNSEGIELTNSTGIELTRSEGIDAYKSYPVMAPPAKISLLKKVSCQRILIGTSRVEFALNPLDPHWSDMMTCNLGLSGSSIGDQVKMIELALESTNVREVIWGLDFQSFAKNHKHVLKKNEITSLLSWAETKESIKVVSRFLQDIKSGYDSYGFLAIPPLKALALTRFQNDVKQYTLDQNMYLDYRLDKEVILDVLKIKDRLLSKNIKIHFLVLPVHAAHFQIRHKMKLDATYKKWILNLIQYLKPIYISAEVTFPNDEPVPLNYQKMRWFWDTNHITKEYGAIIIADFYSQTHSMGTFISSPENYLRLNEKSQDLLQSWAKKNEKLLTTIGLK